MCTVATIEENLSHFSKRDIASALKARQLLARMSFRSVEDAKLTVRHGTNFTFEENSTLKGSMRKRMRMRMRMRKKIKKEVGVRIGKRMRVIITCTNIISSAKSK